MIHRDKKPKQEGVSADELKSTISTLEEIISSYETLADRDFSLDRMYTSKEIRDELFEKLTHREMGTNDSLQLALRERDTEIKEAVDKNNALLMGVSSAVFWFANYYKGFL